jgi:hypothetical protein
MGMGKISRRIITITITETWTITWTTADETQRQATTVVQDKPSTKEKSDELLQATVSNAEPAVARRIQAYYELPRL